MNLQLLCDQAIALYRRGEWAGAEELYRQVLDRDPASPDIHVMHGLCLQALQRPEQALASYDRALALRPDNIAALLNRGTLLRRGGQFAQALADYDRALAIDPACVDALANRGTVLRNLGRPEDALASFDTALKLAPGAAAWLNRGTALQDLRRFGEALVSYGKALALKADLAEGWNNRGTCLEALRRPAEALENYDKALAMQPAYFDAARNRGALLRGMGRFEDALAEYDRALGLAPDSAQLLQERGRLLHAMRNLAEALASYSRAVAADPGFAEAYGNRGNVLRDMERTEEALADYDRAIALDPANAAIHYNRATALLDLNRPVEAAAAYKKVLSLEPDFAYARGDLLHAQMRAADWQDFESQAAALKAGVEAGKRVVLPFVYQALSDSPADLQACSVIYARDRHPQAVSLRPPAHRHADKIRIGYVCGEFREHATAYLMAGLFERHDRDRFEIMAFDTGWDDNSPTRKRLEKAFASLTDIAGLSDRAAAERIARAQIDILVNLNGYCGLGSMGVFAMRPAPVQVSYLGFPATLGASYMDYILADRFVIPEDERRYYTEEVVWLPGSYQVNDVYRPFTMPSPDRGSQGLGRASFVFCNFNQSYKLTPGTFATWMKILAAVPGSVLWLMQSNPDQVANLRRQAAHHGMAPERLVFAGPLPLEQHWARIGLADLCLDSLPYNAHTTAADALRAGVPVLTCRGNSFAGRVAASVLHAIGLPELVTENRDDYTALALSLARDPARLGCLRDKLAEARLSMPLFDTERFARHIESAYVTMADISRSGEAPRSFAVAADPPA